MLKKIVITLAQLYGGPSFAQPSAAHWVNLRTTKWN